MAVTLKKFTFFFGLFVVLVASYLFAKITSVFIASQFPNDVIMPLSVDKEEGATAATSGFDADVGAILRRNFFDPEETVFDTAITETDTATGTGMDVSEDTSEDDPLKKPAVKTVLPIQLLSAVAVGNGENDISSCVLSTGGKEIDTYTRRKNPTDPAIKIQRILPKRVEFLNGSRLEYVELADAAKPIDLAAKPDRSKSVVKKTVKSDEPAEIGGDGDKFTIPRSVIEDATSKMEQLYTDIRAVPYFEEGSPKGFKLLSVKKGSLFDRLGLRRGDILKTINGSVLSLESGMKLFQDLKDESNLILDIDRRGVAKTLNYEII